MAPSSAPSISFTHSDEIAHSTKSPKPLLLSSTSGATKEAVEASTSAAWPAPRLARIAPSPTSLKTRAVKVLTTAPQKKATESSQKGSGS